MKERILIVEDDGDIREMIQAFFASDYEFTMAEDGQVGLEKLKEQSFDLVILDVMMPKVNGIEMLRLMRDKYMTPVLMLSAKDTDMDKAVGLGFGADDYLAKPFSMIELQARIKAIIRRTKVYSSPVTSGLSGSMTLGNLEINFDAYQVSKEGRDLKLTAKEFEILKLFAQNPTRVYTKAQLYELVWGEEFLGEDNLINVHMRRLREKVEDDPSDPKIIVTLWGIGYKLGEEMS